MKLTKEFREKVREAILEYSDNHGGSNAAFAKTLGISAAIYSRLKKGETEQIISDANWLVIARQLQVVFKSENWKTARTKVYSEIESNLKFCQQANKSMMLVDECGIGKTYCARHIVKSMKNAFYFDCSQAKTKSQFIRLLAQTIGVSNKGKYVEVKNNLKYYLSNVLESPLIVLDEAGDLDYAAFMELKEMWNATENVAAWYMMGADGLRSKITKGINSHKVGYAEIFSRFSDEFIKLVPLGKEDKIAFYKDLIGAVAVANASKKAEVNKLVRSCLSTEKSLRYLETLIKIAA